MTLHVSNLMIGRFAGKQIRDLLRKVEGGFREDWLLDQGYPTGEANDIVAALEQGNYIARDPEAEKRWPSEFRWFTLTDAGCSLRLGSAAKRISRKTAQSALDNFMQRVREVNENPRFLERVTEVVVYGSYVRGEQKLGDLDLACKSESKITDPNERIRAAQEQFRKSGREYHRIGDDIWWPNLEVWLFLKNRKRTISLHSIDDFIGMDKDANFTYRVLMGDAESIAQRLQQAARGRCGTRESASNLSPNVQAEMSRGRKR